jgi:hypothetical protein
VFKEQNSFIAARGNCSKHLVLLLPSTARKCKLLPVPSSAPNGVTSTCHIFRPDHEVAREKLRHKVAGQWLQLHCWREFGGCSVTEAAIKHRDTTFFFFTAIQEGKWTSSWALRNKYRNIHKREQNIDFYHSSYPCQWSVKIFHVSKSDVLFHNWNYAVIAVPYLRHLVTDFPPRRPRFEPRSGHVGFVVEKMVLRQVFSEYFGFPCQFPFHRPLHTHHLSSEAGTKGQLVTGVPSGLKSHPNWQNLKRNGGYAVHRRRSVLLSLSFASHSKCVTIFVPAPWRLSLFIPNTQHVTTSGFPVIFWERIKNFTGNFNNIIQLEGDILLGNSDLEQCPNHLRRIEFWMIWQEAQQFVCTFLLHMEFPSLLITMPLYFS